MTLKPPLPGHFGFDAAEGYTACAKQLLQTAGSPFAALNTTSDSGEFVAVHSNRFQTEPLKTYFVSLSINILDSVKTKLAFDDIFSSFQIIGSCLMRNPNSVFQPFKNCEKLSSGFRRVTVNIQQQIRVKPEYA